MCSSSAPVSPAITDSAVSRAASRHRSSNGSCACSASADCVLPLHATQHLHVSVYGCRFRPSHGAAQVQSHCKRTHGSTVTAQCMATKAQTASFLTNVTLTRPHWVNGKAEEHDHGCTAADA